ncbi:MAG: D-2-hydroxyacid dehydrogenase [Phototrophicales bacterium]|nr:D-2-hydroxyacid dehydrogenase [Phototrophicales bacterium]
MSDAPINVLVAMNFSEEILNRLRAISDRLNITCYAGEVPPQAYADIEVLYTIHNFPTPAEAPKLKWIQLHFAGLDGVVNRPIVQQEHIQITSASGIHATPISEYCIGMMLAFSLQLPKMWRLQQESKWADRPQDTFKPIGLRGQVLGIVGYGSIGRELARIADAMGMTILATKNNLLKTAEELDYIEPNTGDPNAEIPERIYPSEALGAMVEACDYVVVTAPLTEKTHHMVNADILKRMKPNAMIINIGRGAVIDENALIEALQNGTIAGAALDVFEQEPLPATSPLWEMKNVIISPHVSGNNTRYTERASQVFEENLRHYLAHQPMLNQFDRKRGY